MDTQLIIQEYYKNPLCNHVMEHYTVSYQEGNAVCGDDIIVFLRIEEKEGQKVIVDYSFTGNTSMITSAAASFLSEYIMGESIFTVCDRNLETMQAW